MVRSFTGQRDQNHSHVYVHGIASSCHLVIVTFRSKSVVLILLATMVAGFSAAMAQCWSTGPMGSHHPCLPNCSEMASMTQGPQLSARHQDSGCCQIAPARPTPESQSFVPAGIEIGTPVIQSTTANVPLVSSPIAFDSDSGPTSAHLPSQSVLCTFLI
jgi:hypothetical protein